jgi:hypothetical protein
MRAPFVVIALFLFSNIAQAQDTLGEALYGTYRPKVLLDIDDYPVILSSNQLTRCKDSACELAPKTSLINSPIGPLPGGGYIGLDVNNYPYTGGINRGTRRLVTGQCNDVFCEGRDESYFSIYDAHEKDLAFSAVLDNAGIPAIMFERENGSQAELTLLRCTTLTCTGARNLTLLDSATGVGGFFSQFQEAVLRLDDDDFPVIARRIDGVLNIIHCNDQYCAGNNESVETPLGSRQIGQYLYLELDAAGNPALLYTDGSEQNYLLRCNDPNCAGGDETETLVDANNKTVLTSLELDASDYPTFVGVKDEAEYSGLMFIRCNDRFCTGNDESIVMPHISRPGLLEAESEPFLLLDDANNPVIAFRHYLMRCGTGTCKTREVEIDFEPYDPLNEVSAPDSNFRVGVAILGSADFDATTVDPDHIYLGWAEPAKRFNRLEDVNNDGFQDYIFEHYARTGVQPCTRDNLLIFAARTTSGEAIYDFETYVHDIAPCDLSFSFLNVVNPPYLSGLHPHHNGGPDAPFGIDDIIYARTLDNYDPSTFRLGPSGAPLRPGFVPPANLPGDRYATYEFMMSDTGIACWADEVVLTASDAAGVNYEGTQSIWGNCNAQCH